MTSNIGSEWKKWDLHVHSASSYDYKYNGADADKKLCQVLLDNEICAVAFTFIFGLFVLSILKYYELKQQKLKKAKKKTNDEINKLKILWE